MKPVIIYVDDEPNNLAVFEAAMPEDWEIVCFDSPARALAEIDKIKPWVVVSDQRMPGMKGIEFLEVAQKLVPEAQRIIVTGFSDEDLVVESVRKARVSDYIRKPWDIDDLEHSLAKSIESYRLDQERRTLYEELQTKTADLERQTRDLKHASTELEIAAIRERDLRRELECWVPPFVIWTLTQQDIKFPIQKDLVGITFDIVGSSQIHDKKIAEKPVRARILELFSEAVLRNGGWRESHSGDSAYGHFGLQDYGTDPFESALATAREFRVALRGVSQQMDEAIECGVALHFAKDVSVDVHTIQLQTPRGIVTQKSFDTTSLDIDLLHRVEKLVHELPGSNIILTDQFVTNLKKTPPRLEEIGVVEVRGQSNPVELFLIRSDLVSDLQFEEFKQSLGAKTSRKVA